MPPSWPKAPATTLAIRGRTGFARPPLGVGPSSDPPAGRHRCDHVDADCGQIVTITDIAPIAFATDDSADPEQDPEDQPGERQDRPADLLAVPGPATTITRPGSSGVFTRLSS